LGDGYLDSSSIIELNELKNEVISLAITKLRIMGEGRIVVGTVLTSDDIDEEFYFRELGLFALDPDEGEILYCYGNAGDLAEHIPNNGVDIIEKTIDIQTVVGNASNITAVLDSVIYATLEESQQYTDQEVSKRISKTGDTMTGDLLFDSTEGEKRIRTSNDNFNHGLAFGSHGINMYDWKNTRYVLSYDASDNSLSIPVANTNINSLVTITKDSQNLILRGTGAGNLNNAFMTYQDSNETRQALVGFNSTSNRTFIIHNDMGDINLNAPNGTIQIKGVEVETVKGSQKRIEQTSYSTIKTNKVDAEFQLLEKKRTTDNSLYCRSVLSGQGPNYPIRTITYFDFDGVTVDKVEVYDLIYDEDDDVINEVIRVITQFIQIIEKVDGVIVNKVEVHEFTYNDVGDVISKVVKDVSEVLE